VELETSLKELGFVDEASLRTPHSDDRHNSRELADEDRGEGGGGVASVKDRGVEGGGGGGKFGYLLAMPLWSATVERRTVLHEQEVELARVLQELQSTSAEDMWLAELARLRVAVAHFLREPSI